MKFLLDTNVIAEMRKGSRANTHVRAWFAALDPEAIRLSVTIGLLAATAKVHGLTLATRNVKDVAASGAAVVNPFEP